MLGNMRFFELLQVAIGNRECLTSCLTDEEWDSLYFECEKHNILGIAYVGITKLPKEQCPSSHLLETWSDVALTMKERNSLLNKRCREMCEYFDGQGMNSCVLMPIGKYRTPDDIDVLCWSKKGKDSKIPFVEYVNFQYVSSSRHIKPKVVRQNVDWETGSFQVEPHFKFSYFNCPWHDRRFKKFVEKKVLMTSPFVRPLDTFPLVQRDGDFPVLSNVFKAVYQLIHLYRKFFCEEIRIGHLLDYYLVLRSLRDESPDENVCKEIMLTISRLGLKKFTGAVMYVMQEVFASPDEYLLCKPNPRNGSFVLKMTMLAGEYTNDIERTRTLRHLGRIGHYLYWLKRNRPFLTQYPMEILFDLYRRIKG